MTKKYHIRHHQICLFKLKMHKTRFRPGLDTLLGELTTPPRPLVGWKMGYIIHCPYPPPPLGVSNSAATAPPFSAS